MHLIKHQDKISSNTMPEFGPNTVRQEDGIPTGHELAYPDPQITSLRSCRRKSVKMIESTGDGVRDMFSATTPVNE